MAVATNRPPLTDAVEDLWTKTAARCLHGHGVSRIDTGQSPAGSSPGLLATADEVTGVVIPDDETVLRISFSAQLTIAGVTGVAGSVELDVSGITYATKTIDWDASGPSGAAIYSSNTWLSIAQQQGVVYGPGYVAPWFEICPGAGTYNVRLKWGRVSGYTLIVAQRRLRVSSLGFQDGAS